MANENTKKPENDTQQAKKVYDAELQGKSLNAPDDLYQNISAKVKKIEEACKALNILIGSAYEQNTLKKSGKISPSAPRATNANKPK